MSPPATMCWTAINTPQKVSTRKSSAENVSECKGMIKKMTKQTTAPPMSSDKNILNQEKFDGKQGMPAPSKSIVEDVSAEGKTNDKKSIMRMYPDSTVPMKPLQGDYKALAEVLNTRIQGKRSPDTYFKLRDKAFIIWAQANTSWDWKKISVLLWHETMLHYEDVEIIVIEKGEMFRILDANVRFKHDAILSKWYSREKENMQVGESFLDARYADYHPYFEEFDNPKYPGYASKDAHMRKEYIKTKSKTKKRRRSSEEMGAEKQAKKKQCTNTRDSVNTEIKDQENDDVYSSPENDTHADDLGYVEDEINQTFNDGRDLQVPNYVPETQDDIEDRWNGKIGYATDDEMRALRINTEGSSTKRKTKAKKSHKDGAENDHAE